MFWKGYMLAAFKLCLFVLGYAVYLAGWSAEGTILVITAIATVLLPSVGALVGTIIKIFRRVDELEILISKQKEEIKTLLLQQNSSLNRIEDKVHTPGDAKLQEELKGVS